MLDEGLSLSWSVRDEAPDDLSADRVLGDLARICHETCTTHFDEDAGYSIVQRRMWGALEGSTTEIRRGSFHAVVSVQRFRRNGGQRDAEFRVVASADYSAGTASTATALARRSAPGKAVWLTVSTAAGTTCVAVIGMHLAGLLSTWVQLALLLPMLLLWRVTMALHIAEDLTRESRQASALPEPPTRGSAADLQRWRKVLDRIACERDAVAEVFYSPGFRSPGALPGSVAALAAATLPAAAPTRTIQIPDLAMPPLGRTTAM